LCPVYITGVAESPLGHVDDQTELSMAALAAREALDEAGLTLADVDGLFVNYMGEEGSVQVGEYLGIQPRYADSTDIGGASYLAHVHHAALAIEAGHCDVALIAYASRQRSRRLRSAAYGLADPLANSHQFESPSGLATPLGTFALLAARHMHLYGTTSEQLAAVAVAARRWAQLNSKAWVRDDLDIEGVLASRPICDPLRRLDCCLVTDGGGAVVVVGEARSRDSAKRRVRVLGAGESHVHWMASHMPDPAASPGAASARDAFDRSGIGPDNVDFVQPYDAATITALCALEDLGLCERGEGGALAASGALAPGGSLPAMTSGGGLSYCHPGALGILLIIESVRQLRGEAGDRQVPDAKIGVAHGIGGLWSAAATVVLAHD
jgi:acetyl-CoA acetyltransferase